jgi:pimeloyl-ACP methyl ester carboxylesterase
MKIYLIPGLGADKRMYQPQLKLWPEAEVLEHLTPVRGETLTQYAARLAPSIDTAVPFILIGTSLGGMISLELTKYVKPEKVILIASVKGREELPAFIKSMRYLNFHRLIPPGIYKHVNGLMAARLDSRRDSTVASLIREMTIDASPQFIDWAINAVINWKPSFVLPENLVHIHGSNDTLFPLKYIKQPIVIKNGSHVMNLTLSAEVNKALQKAVYG